MSYISLNESTLRDLSRDATTLMVMYCLPESQMCEDMLLEMDKLAGNPKYHQMTFVKVNAEESPIASAVVKRLDMPMLVLYNNGFITEVIEVNTPEALQAAADRLLKMVQTAKK